MLAIVKALKGRYKVDALDLPGFSKSDTPRQVYDSCNYAEIVKRFMEEENKKTDFIGHYFWRKISIIFASKYKDMVNRIVLIYSTGLIPKRWAKYHIRVYSFKAVINEIFK